MVLTKEYFSAPATLLAPGLLGKIICVRSPQNDVIRARITETECYYGEGDTAVAALRGVEVAFARGTFTAVILSTPGSTN